MTNIGGFSSITTATRIAENPAIKQPEPSTSEASMQVAGQPDPNLKKNAGRGSFQYLLSKVTTENSDKSLSQTAPPYSRATINGQNYEVNEKTPENIKKFLTMALSNNAYDSFEHLEQRANAFLRYIGVEEKILDKTATDLQSPSTDVHKQSAWMAHLERGLWANESNFGELDRMKLGAQAAGLEEPTEGYHFHGARALNLSDVGRSGFGMMLRGEQGPFTLEQAQYGFEYAQTGEVLAGKLKLEDRVQFRAENRVYAKRSGTHYTKTESGLDLSADTGTKVRDSMGLPVMSGTSGSSSDAVIAIKFAAQRANVSWAAPGVDEAKVAETIARLSLHYFRGKSAGTSISGMEGMNSLRSQMGISPKFVDEKYVFSHSYPEIYAGVKLTLDGAKHDDVDAFEKSSQEAADHLNQWISPAGDFAMPHPAG